ncbi:GNAT family N-acetyltransferase [Aureispira anguillae]|uniref:GNAT family N-acetyltransferase n=1 Tax=Aureispira anguillae TaxID=2864201 RepID=A0A915YC88_9BACT|nr:GNAT family N-acetyltransferase [Aureispira anguillae]BDS10396.1 GNAT family N-acetyltransferase [Aureispira anguillae]
MNYTIRVANEDDFASILALIKELAVFENAPEKVVNSVEQMKAEQDLFHCFVVENTAKEIIGMALYYFAYYTWVGKSLYLDDLYINEQYRGHGIGSELLKKIFEVAKNTNCKRVRWQVLNWNTPAIDLYKKCGADLDNEWSNCDFDAKGIQEFEIA